MSLNVQNSLPKLNCNTLWNQSGFSSMDTSPSATSARNSIASYGFLGGSPSKESTQRMNFEDHNQSYSSSMSLETLKDVDGEDFRKVASDKEFSKEPETVQEEAASDEVVREDRSTSLGEEEDLRGAAIVSEEKTEDHETASLHYSSDAVDATDTAGTADTADTPHVERAEMQSERAEESIGESSSEPEQTRRAVAFNEKENQHIFNTGITPTKVTQLDPEQIQIRRSFSDGVIDNTTLEYVPIRLKCGINVMCAPQVLSASPLVLRCLQTDAQRLFTILPRSVHDLLRRTKIWVNASYSYGSFDDPQILRHSTAHHSDEWLVNIAKDIPEKACSIEIYDCRYYERMRLHWNGAGLLLHEFCHLVHQFCLGLDNSKVMELYLKADCSGKYNETPRRDWAGCDKTHDMAYALVDQKEFFSEMSVSYLSTGYRHLNKADSSVLETCCPPILLPDVFDRVLRQHGIDDPLERPEDSMCYILNYAQRRHPKPKLEIADPIFRERAIATNCRKIPICNKFYPFTRGQLKHYDPSLCHAMGGLWKEIARWKDPEAESSSICAFPTLF